MATQLEMDYYNRKNKCYYKSKWHRYNTINEDIIYLLFVGNNKNIETIWNLFYTFVADNDSTFCDFALPITFFDEYLFVKIPKNIIYIINDYYTSIKYGPQYNGIIRRTFSGKYYN